MVAIDIHLYDLRNLTSVSLNWDAKKSRRRMVGAERVGWRITSEVRRDQSQLIPLSSHQAPTSYFALLSPLLIILFTCFDVPDSSFELLIVFHYSTRYHDM